MSVKSPSPISYRVLLTNSRLSQRTGTECVVRDLAIGLLRRGHRPIVYSPTLGELGEEIRVRGIPVIDDLRHLAEPPDVIHGHHLIPTSEAIIHFPRVPAIFVAHSWNHWADRPPKFPQIFCYAAVSEAVRDRLVHEEGIGPSKVVLLLNAVDLLRLPRRTRPLAGTDLRAICFTRRRAHVPALRAACEQSGIEFVTLGQCGDRIVAKPEKELVNCDIVFATGRCALEALCCGAAVVVCDSNGLGGFVTSESYPRFRQLNFALRSLGQPNTLETVASVLKDYDPKDAARVADRARDDASLETRLDQLLEIYQSAIAASGEFATNEYQDALFEFLHEALPRRPGDRRWPWQIERDELVERLADLDRQLAEEQTLSREAESWRITAPLRWLGTIVRARLMESSKRRKHLSSHLD